MRNNHPEELGTPELEGGRSLQSAVPASWGGEKMVKWELAGGKLIKRYRRCPGRT